MVFNRYGYLGKLFLLTKSIFKFNFGKCSVCNQNTFFVLNGNYERDHLECLRCGSLPRHRAFMLALNSFIPDWSLKSIHESSPGGSSSNAIRSKSSNYSFSQFYLDKKLGEKVEDHECQNLEKLTYPDNNFDLFITQEVLEHVFNADKALSEINRVLKPGGYHIFTTPYRNWTPTIKRAELLPDETVNHIFPEEFHGNPIGNGKSLVTYDWGNDFGFLINKWSNMQTLIFEKRDKKLGLEGELLEVFVCRKQP